MATNRDLRRAYTVWATIYDPMTRLLRASRRRSIGLLYLRPWDSVLLVGCGTGADFEFLPREAQCVGVDLTPAMLRRAAAKVGDRRIRLEEMDAMDLRFPDATFDKTILHHILAVVSDPVRTLREAERVTKPGGHLVVLDKFWNRGHRPPLPLRLASAVFGRCVTTVDRNFNTILARTSLEVLQEVPMGFGGLYHAYLLRKLASPAEYAPPSGCNSTIRRRSQGVSCRGEPLEIGSARHYIVWGGSPCAGPPPSTAGTARRRSMPTYEFLCPKCQKEFTVSRCQRIG